MGKFIFGKKGWSALIHGLCAGLLWLGLWDAPLFTARADLLVEPGSLWRWRPGTSEASNPSDAWRGLSFVDQQFTTAPAPFWYGDPYAGGTVITGMQNVYLCLFLRKTFVVTNVAEVASLQLGAIVDDGFVAWINGVEVQRVNMPEPAGSPVSIGTLANNAVEPVAFATYDLRSPKNYLVQGTNVLAVQVFQSSLGSSDIGFDCSLESTLAPPPPDLPPTVAAITPPPGSTLRSLSAVTILFNKDVRGVEAGDLRINGDPARSLSAVTPSQYVFEFPQPPAGAVQFSWAVDSGITDLSPLGRSFTGESWTYTVDPNAPPAIPYISEFMAANSRILKDEDGDFSDWIEIYNPGSAALNLEDWSLTDTTNNLAKWRFPATNLAANTFLVVFASEKNRRTPGRPLHTNFKLASEGEYLALARPEGTNRASEFKPAFPPQVSDVSFGVVQLGDAPFPVRTNVAYFTGPTPGEPNNGGVAVPGPPILDVQHSPLVPDENEDLRITARVTPAFSGLGAVTLHYRVMFGLETSLAMFDDGAHGDGVANDGVFGATVSAGVAKTGQMIRYYVSALDQAGRTSRWPLFIDRAASPQYLGTVVHPGYVTSNIPVIHLFALETILQPGPNTSQTGADAQAGSAGVSVFYDGEFYDNVFVALRGNTTAGYNKKSHRFEFTRDHPFRHPGVGYGWPEKAGKRLHKTSFEADYPDPTYMRQGLSYWLCDQVGSPASFYYPVRLQLNGAFYQLANHNDVQGEELLDRLGYDPQGALYNAAGTVEPSQFSTGGFEKKTRRWEGTQDYQALANAISESRPTALRRTNVFDMLDLPNVINYLVAARFAQENDDVWANMSIYHDNDGDDLWRIVSFDMNLSWGAFFLDNPQNDTGIQATNDNHKSFPLYGSSQALSLTSGNYNRIYDVIFDVPQTLEMFRRRMRTMLDTYVLPPGSPANSSRVEQKITAWRDLIVPEAALDRAKWGWPGVGGQNNLSPANLATGVNDLLQKFFYPRRQHFYGKHSVTNTALTIGTLKTQNAGFPLPQPSDASLAVVDLDFNPISHIRDEEYICLTNAMAVALDVSGWRLEGAVDFRFAPGTVVPAQSSIYVSPDLRAFRSRKLSPHGREGRFVVGPYSGQLSARGETLLVKNGQSNVVHTFTYAGDPSALQNDLRITEIMYHPATLTGNSAAGENEYLELKNISPNASLNLAGVRFIDGVGFDFSSAAVTNLAPGESVVIVRDSAAFVLRYGTARRVAGEFQGALDNKGERLRMVDAAGEEILDFQYSNDWFPQTDGGGFALRILEENADPATWSSKTNWTAVNPLAGLDSDGDGMPDDWEIAHGLDPRRSDADLDSDGDGMTNLAEFLTGTDPRDAGSLLQLRLTLTTATIATLQFTAEANRSYTIEAIDSLTGTVWQRLADDSAEGVRRVVSVTDSVLPGTRYYRVITPRRP